MAYKTKQELREQNDLFIKDNSNREITEEVLRNHLRDIIDSLASPVVGGGIYIIKKFVIQALPDSYQIASEINVKFFDYGAGTTASSSNYDYVKFKIEQKGVVIHDGVLTNITNYHSKLLEFIINTSDYTTDNTTVTAYIDRNIDAINRIDGRNHGFGLLRGDRSNYRDGKKKTLHAFTANTYSPLMADIWTQLSAMAGITVPSTIDNNAVWMSGVSSSMYTAIKSTDSRVPFGYPFSEGYNRKVFNPDTDQYENISLNGIINGFDPVHHKRTGWQIYVNFSDTGSKNIMGNSLRVQVFRQMQSLVQFNLYEVQKGVTKYYYILVKPCGLDTFDLSYFDTLKYSLYAVLDDGYSSPIIRKVAAEDLSEAVENRSFRVRKSAIFKSGMMLNRATASKSINARGQKEMRFFYTDNQGNASGFSPKVVVVNKKRGYTTGLMIDN